MKKIILIIATMLAFASCDEVIKSQYEPHTDEHGVTEQAISFGTGESVYKVTIEGHEYLKFISSVYAGHAIAVVHSASCPADHEHKNAQLDDEGENNIEENVSSTKIVVRKKLK